MAAAKAKAKGRAKAKGKAKARRRKSNATSNDGQEDDSPDEPPEPPPVPPPPEPPQPELPLPPEAVADSVDGPQLEPVPAHNGDGAMVVDSHVEVEMENENVWGQRHFVSLCLVCLASAFASERTSLILPIYQRYNWLLCCVISCPSV